MKNLFPNKWSYGSWFFTIAAFANMATIIAGYEIIPDSVEWLMLLLFLFCIYMEYREKRGGGPPKFVKKAKKKLKAVKDLAVRKVEGWGAQPGLAGA
ncbi:membrane protein [Gordonia phage Suzy]|uniref:Membrane protein n=1 Tax=Gordonia phage Suzy TaxID=2201430 RepID=A0A2Z4Q805_9CAUD|nr:membrane protein [Gordonia phage Suzy]AWY06182.1 membrane protein [Gordonia phage Suzy]